MNTTWSCPIQCKVFDSVPGHYCVYVNSVLSYYNQKCLLILLNVLWKDRNVFLLYSFEMHEIKMFLR